MQMRAAIIIIASALLGMIGSAIADEPAVPKNAPPAGMPRMEWTVAEACDPDIAQRAPYLPKADGPRVLVELERGAQVVLAEERRLERPPPARDVAMLWAVVGSLAAIGLVVGGIGFVRRRRGLLLGGAVVLVLALVSMRLVRPALGLGSHEAELVRLARCRVMLVEARATLQQSRLGRCLAAIDEVEEELLGWEYRARNGPPITVEDVKHLREEAGEY